VSDTRDRVKNPSINFPQSEKEAQYAIIHQTRRALFDETAADRSPFLKTRTNDAGFGLTRRDEQTKWLNDAADLIGALIADRLDEIKSVL